MNYTEIKDISLSYSDREDSDLPSRLDGFLYVVESKMNRVLESLNMETVQQFAWVSDTTTLFDLPSGFEGLRAVRLRNTITNKVDYHYEMVNPEQLHNAVTNGSDNSYYVLRNNQIEIYPAFTTGYVLEIVYSKTLTPLSSTNTTNWLSIKYPDCYIRGLLVEISIFAKAWEDADMYKKLFEQALEEVTLKETVNKHSGNPMRTRIG